MRIGPLGRPRPVGRLLHLSLAALLAGAAACGGDDGASGDDSGGDGDGAGSDDGDGSDEGGSTADASSGAADSSPRLDATTTLFILSSAAFEEGGEIPLRHACALQGGDDLSPPLAWSGGPPAAGYALVLTDLSQGDGFVHSVLWDVPGDVTSLPENIEKVAEPDDPPGSKQALAFDGETRGYRGPCPSEQHTYEFALHVVDENPLSGVTIDSTRDEVADALARRALLTTRLTGTFTPPPSARR